MMKMMNYNLSSKLAGTALALSLLAAPAAAAEFGDWDTNADAGLDSNEFRAGFESNELFEEWDTNDDGALSEDEFDAGLGDDSDAFSSRYGDDNGFAEWDANNDEALDEDEFYNGAYSGYDDDDDNVIEEPEFGDLNDDMGDEGFWDV